MMTRLPTSNYTAVTIRWGFMLTLASILNTVKVTAAEPTSATSVRCLLIYLFSQNLPLHLVHCCNNSFYNFCVLEKVGREHLHYSASICCILISFRSASYVYRLSQENGSGTTTAASSWESGRGVDLGYASPCASAVSIRNRHMVPAMFTASRAWRAPER